jgi:hypothetical protein
MPGARASLLFGIRGRFELVEELVMKIRHGSLTVGFALLCLTVIAGWSARAEAGTTTVTVDARTGPWSYVNGGLNTAFQYGVTVSGAAVLLAFRRWRKRRAGSEFTSRRPALLGLAWAGALLIAAITTPARAELIVDAAPPAVYSGIFATPGQVFQITASGVVDLSSTNGGYQTDANGTIVAAPSPGTGAYDFFTNDAGPVGVPPAVGDQKTIEFVGPNDAPVPGAPYGALTAGFSTTLTPASYTADFPSGITVVGTSSTIVAPSTGGYLFFSVNDILGFSPRLDNEGSFTVDITAVPEPSSITWLASMIPMGIWYTLRRRKPAHV